MLCTAVHFIMPGERTAVICQAETYGIPPGKIGDWCAQPEARDNGTAYKGRCTRIEYRKVAVKDRGEEQQDGKAAEKPDLG